MKSSPRKTIKPHRAKKSLGQNFLKSVSAIRKIIEAGEIAPDDLVLEIGPGKGALTEKLLEKAKTVIAVEKDRELFEFLKAKFGKEVRSKKLILVEEDILKFDIGEGKYKIVANIPYNITGAILKQFLTAKNQPEAMILMVQHEVAQRILSPKGSLLAMSVRAYAQPKMIMKVPARYFSPAPRVDSAVIAITDISRHIFEKENINEENFWKIVRAGFAHKRKKLSGNLKNVVSLEKRSAIGEKRAEDLKLPDWLALSEGGLSQKN